MRNEFTAIIERDDDWFIAYCPEVPGANGQGRTLFWDFLKNLALGAGFLLITFGTGASSVRRFIAHPTWSSDPYRIVQREIQP